MRVRREFEQRERIAGGRAIQPGRRLRGQPEHQHGGLIAGQATQPQGRKISAVEQGRLAVPDRDQYRDGIGHQPADGEQQRLRARTIQPVGVIDHHHQRRILGVGREQAERGGADREPFLPGSGPQRQRALHRGRLGPRDLPQHRQRRADQLEQGCERYLGFRFDPPGPQQPHSGRLPGGVVEQRRLPDSRLASQRKRRARPRSRPIESKPDFLPLTCPPQQHGAIVGTWSPAG